MGYDHQNDTYATSCDEFSDSESELSSVEQLFKGYEPALIILDGSDHALFTQIEQLIDALRASKLIQQVRVSTPFLQGLDNDGDCEEAHALFSAIAGLHPICETFICHLHRHLPRHKLQEKDGGLWKCAATLQRLTINNFLLTDDLIEALGSNQELIELRAYFNSKEEEKGLDPLLFALAKSPKLQTLDVYAKEDERPEKPRRVTAEGLTALLHNPTLTEVKLWHLDSELTVAMAKALESPDCKVKQLSLMACFIKDDGYTALANMLKVNNSLEKLVIGDIVSAESCLRLAEGLEMNKCLKELELTYESASDDVGKAMVKALEANTTIHYLKLFMSYSFENDMSFSGEKGAEYEDVAAQDGSWEAKIDKLLDQNRAGAR